MFYVYLPDKQGGIPITADRLLRSIGASGRYTGFDYAVYMIEQVVDSQESIRLITKRLYPETARHFGVKPHSVEHALRRGFHRPMQANPSPLFSISQVVLNHAAVKTPVNRTLSAPP